MTSTLRNKKEIKQTISKFWKSFSTSIWFFPTVALLPLIILTAAGINGSSMGAYYPALFGDGKDPSLILNEPRGIRSDEWLVNSQMTIAQERNGFNRINENIGNGEDMSILIDAPYKDWSIIFKPHNLAFFLIPFDNAFAFRWWVMAYLLTISAYFFILSLLPGKRLLASLLAISILFTPFIQWWYLYGTLGSIYYCLFAAVIFKKILDGKNKKYDLLWAVLLAYIGTCFALVLYPPFQIPSAIVTFAFLAGLVIHKYKSGKGIVLQKFVLIGLSVFIAAALVATYAYGRSEVISTVQQTAYPGKRVVESGGFDKRHLLVNHLGYQFQDDSISGQYSVPLSGLNNQSETSNFILLMPFLVIPSLVVLYIAYKRQGKLNYQLLSTIVVFALFLAWLYIPGLSIIGKLTLLELVPQERIIIGIGLLTFINTVLFIKVYSELEDFKVRKFSAAFYSVLVGLILLLISLSIVRDYPNFLGLKRAILFSLPLPVIVYLILRKRFIFASVILLFFGIFMTYKIHPFYRGTGILRNSSITKAIEKTPDDGKLWAVEYSPYENISIMSGRKSLSGVYVYPQLDIWDDASETDSEKTYNRYAHISFDFDRQPDINLPTELKLVSEDNIKVKTEPCGKFLLSKNVGYLLAAAELPASDTCAELIDNVYYPAQVLYIYKLHH